jgi:hypothetical protein
LIDLPKLNRIFRRGQQVKQTLEDPVIARALEKMDADITAAWRKTDINDTEAQLNCRLMMRLLDKFKNDLTVEIARGRQAEKEIEAERTKKNA